MTHEVLILVYYFFCNIYMNFVLSLVNLESIYLIKNLKNLKRNLEKHMI